MSVHLRTFLSVLPVYVHYMYVFLLSLLLWDGILSILVFVCVCCAAPDKLTSPPPVTGLGALHGVLHWSSVNCFCNSVSSAGALRYEGVTISVIFGRRSMVNSSSLTGSGPGSSSGKISA